MKIASLALAGAAAVALLAAGCGSTAPAASATSHACKRATAVQNAFGARAIAGGYPNVPAAAGLVELKFDQDLLEAMRDAGCPGNTKIHLLPAG